MKICSVKSSIPGYKLICLYFSMRTDKKITENMLAMRNSLIAGGASNFLITATTGADDYIFFTV